MRKILLASTALVALGSISAHAADITISGSYATGVRTDGDNTTDESSMFSESDVNIKFSNTTDSGITTSLNYGFDEGGNAAEDLTATLSGDFGTFNFDSVGDDGALGGFDGKADKAGEGTTSSRHATAASQISVSGGIMGTANMAIGYTFPTVMDGLKIAVNGSDTTGSGEYFGYGVSYDMGMAAISYVKEASNTVENTYSGLSASFGDISFGYDKSDRDAGSAANDRESTTMGISYAMGDITLAYETGDMKNGSGTELITHAQIAASYAVATGITAVVTTSEVDATLAGHSDRDQLELQLKLAF